MPIPTLPRNEFGEVAEGVAGIRACDVGRQACVRKDCWLSDRRGVEIAQPRALNPRRRSRGLDVDDVEEEPESDAPALCREVARIGVETRCGPPSCVALTLAAAVSAYVAFGVALSSRLETRGRSRPHSNSPIPYRPAP